MRLQACSLARALRGRKIDAGGDVLAPDARIRAVARGMAVKGKNRAVPPPGGVEVGRLVTVIEGEDVSATQGACGACDPARRLQVDLCIAAVGRMQSQGL